MHEAQVADKVESRALDSSMIQSTSASEELVPRFKYEAGHSKGHRHSKYYTAGASRVARVLIIISAHQGLR